MGIVGGREGPDESREESLGETVSRVLGGGGRGVPSILDGIPFTDLELGFHLFSRVWESSDSGSQDDWTGQDSLDSSPSRMYHIMGPTYKILKREVMVPEERLPPSPSHIFFGSLSDPSLYPTFSYPTGSTEILPCPPSRNTSL